MFKITLRNMFKNKAHAFINIAGLSTGMAVAMLIGLWMWDELSFNKSFDNYNSIAQVMQNQTFNGEVQTWANVPNPLGPALQKDYGSNFTYVIRAGYVGDHGFELDNKKFKVSGTYMDVQAPDMLTLHMLKGTRAALSDMHNIILSQSAAKTLFNNDDAVGKVLKMDNLDVKVTGVYEDLPYSSSFASLSFIAPWDLLIKGQGLDKILQNPWGASWFQTYVQIAPNADMAKVSASIKDAKTRNVGADAAKNNPAIFLHPMSRWHLHGEFKNGVDTGGRILYVWLFGITGIFVLLLACINFMNLSTARSEKRAKEVGIRKTVGSTRRQLIWQFLSESVLVTLFAFAVTIFLVQLALPFFNDVAGKQIQLPWANVLFWAMGLGFSLLTGLLAGSYPALYLSSFRPVKVLKGTFRAGRLASVPRRVLVTLQFTVSVILIIGTIVVFKQVQFAKNRPVGYTREGMITIYSDKIHDHFEAFRTELINSGTVTELAESENAVTNNFITNSGFDWKGKAPGMQEEFVTMGVTPEFGKTAGWQIIQGRDFSREFKTDSSAIIINEAAVPYLGFKNPVGESIKWGKNETVHIIGVVKNMITQNPYDPVKQSFYYLRNGYLGNINIRVSPAASTTKALAVIKAAFKKYKPTDAFEYKFVDDEYAKKFDTEERIGKLASAFAILAIFISCLGLFGMASFMAEQRTKEIGVRKVLGASVFNLWRLMSREFAIMVVVALCIATPVAYYCMHTWLLNYQYRTGLSWWVFAATGAGALLITLCTVSYQSIKAALMNPVKSLRSE